MAIFKPGEEYTIVDADIPHLKNLLIEFAKELTDTLARAEGVPSESLGRKIGQTTNEVVAGVYKVMEGKNMVGTELIAVLLLLGATGIDVYLEAGRQAAFAKGDGDGR